MRIVSDRIRLDEAPDFFGPSTLGRITGTNLTQAYALTRTPGFPARRIGRKILISKAGFIRWAEAEGWM